MVKLCVFDLDGTLVNTLHDLTDSLNYALAQCGFPLLTESRVAAIVGHSVERHPVGLEQGFIRMEVMTYDDLIGLGSEAAVHKAGKLRVEGKDYVVKDGDIVVIRFNK